MNNIKILCLCFVMALCLVGCGKKNDEERDDNLGVSVEDNESGVLTEKGKSEAYVVDYKYADYFENIPKVMEFSVNGQTYQMGLKPEEYDFTNYVGGITDGMNVAADEGDMIYKASLESTYNLLEQIEVFVPEEEGETMYENYDESFEFCGIHIGDPIEKADIFGEPALENHHQGGDVYEKMYNVYGENGNNENKAYFHYMYDENGESHIYKIDLYIGLSRMVKEIP